VKSALIPVIAAFVVCVAVTSGIAQAPLHSGRHMPTLDGRLGRAPDGAVTVRDGR